MTVDEIFAKINTHIIKGLMTHSQMADYYDFLGLKGYKRCHEYHYFAENCTYREVNRYFINHYSRLIPEMPIDNPAIIPESWYKYTRSDVDANTKKNAVKRGLTLWVDWEKETKKLYEEMYAELLAIKEIAGAMLVSELICDVNCELKKAERYMLEKKAVDYDMTVIMGEQKCWHKKYKKLEQEVGVSIC